LYLICPKTGSIVVLRDEHLDLALLDRVDLAGVPVAGVTDDRRELFADPVPAQGAACASGGPPGSVPGPRHGDPSKSQGLPNRPSVADDQPDDAPIPRPALGSVLNEQGYYVGRVEHNLVPWTGHSRGATRGSSGCD
jgi:hypothetical protein